MAGEDDQDFEVPDVNLAQFMIDNMKKYGAEVALIDANTEKQYTYIEVILRIQQLAAGLRDVGLHQGDRLCVFMYNNIDYPIIMYATNMLGAVLQTMSPLYKDDDIIKLLKEVRPKFVIAALDQAVRVASLIKTCKASETSDGADFLSKFIVLGQFENSIEYENLFGSSKVTEPVNINPRTTAAILLLSSGTSGASKIIQLSHANIVANLPQLLHVYRHRPGMCTVGVQGIFHHYGNCGVMSTCLYSGVKLVLMEKYELGQYIHNIQKYKADILHLMPPIATELVKSPLRSRADLTSVKFIHSAGSPLGTELMNELMNTFHLPFISQMYGLTETGLITGNYEGAFKLGSSGVLTIGTKLKIVDTDTGLEVAANQMGEILCKGPQITMGYLNRPEITADAFDEDGYFKTGDIGYVDDDGFLFVVDRVKDMIKYGNKQVAPSYIEDMLVKHTDIIDAAVIGIAAGENGKMPKAFVARRESSSITETEISKYIEERMPDHMRLRGGVEFVKKIPRNPTGKRLRRYLRVYGVDAWKHV